MKKLVTINDLYFGIKMPTRSWSKSDPRIKLETRNLFEFSRVKYSVARWVVMSKKEKAKYDFKRWCFGDVGNRFEYEYYVCPTPYKDNDSISKLGKRVDIYTMYVEPNYIYLLELVNSVSKLSAIIYLQMHHRW